MSKVNSVKVLRAKRSKRLAQKRGLPPIKGSSYHRPLRTTPQAPNALSFWLLKKLTIKIRKALALYLKVIP